MRIKIVCGVILLALLFVSTISAQDFLYSRAEPCAFSKLFEEARVIAGGIPVTHSEEVVSYQQIIIRSRSVVPMRYDDYAFRTVPMVFLNTSTCELVSDTVTRRIKNKKAPTLLSTDSGHFIVFVEPRPQGTLWNWWNTPLQVLAPEGWIVAAVHWERHPSGESVVYTPGSADLMNAFPSLAEIGRNHIKEDIASAYILLKDTKSLGVPGMSVSEVMQNFFPTLLETAISIEHADDHEVEVYRNGGYKVNPIDRPFAVIGANLEKAYAYTRSKAGARGLMQVMPKTCLDVRLRYLTTIPHGCYQSPHGHPTELATAMLVFDYHLSILAERLRHRGESPEEFAARPEMKLLLRASYNTGPSRVSKAVRTSKDWSVRLLAETRGYLIKAFNLD